MSAFEYRAVPAPRKGKSAKGVRGGPEKFANALSNVMNEMGAEGWEYMRADTLPCEERQGITGKAVKYHSILVFRRPMAVVAAETEEAAQTLALPVPEPEIIDEAVGIVEEIIEQPEPQMQPEAANDTPDRRETVAAE